MKQLTKVFAAFILVSLSINLSDAQGQSDCVSASNIDIIALESKTINFTVGGVVNDDLSAMNQGLAFINIDFTHDNLADIEVILTSPAGQSIQLIGPLGSGASTTDLVIGWDVTFVPCNELAQPDPGISSEQFSNESNWVAINEYTGSYYPFSGCFEDINIGTVNGIWTLKINDGGRFDNGLINEIEIKFLEQEGLTFTVCEANAGVFSNLLTLTVCDFENDLLLTQIDIDTFTDPSETYNYEFIISDFLSGDILDVQPFPDLRGFPIADYTICALSYRKIDSTEVYDQLTIQSLEGFREFLDQTPAPVCADIMEICTDVMVLAIPDTLKIDTTICENGSFSIFDANGDLVQRYSRPGTFTRKIGENLCDSMVIVNITQVEIKAIISTDTDTIINCPTDTITLGSSRSMVTGPPNRLWTTRNGSIIGDETAAQIKVVDPGTYFLQLDNNQGCVHDTMIVIGENLDVPSLELTVTDTITCNNPNTMVSVSSDDTLFNLVWSGPDFAGDGADITVNDGGMYIVRGDFDNGCSFIDSIQVFENFGIPAFEVNVDLIGCMAQISFVDSSVIPNDAKWISPTGIELEELTPIVSEQGVYDLVATSGNGCTDTIPVTIMYDPPIDDLVLTGNSLSCDLSSSIISIVGDKEFLSVLWEGPGIITSDDSILVDSIGTFTVRTIDMNNCPGIGSFELVTDTIPPEVTIQGRNFGCTENEITITAVSDGALDDAIWEGPNAMSTGSEFQIDAVGVYSIAVSGNNGCIGRDTVIIGREEPFNVAIEDAIFDCDLQPISLITNISITPQQLEWTGPNGFSDVQQEITAVDTGLYILAVTSEDQCVVVDSIMLGIREANISIRNVEDLTIDCNSDSVQIMPQVNGDFTIAVWTNEDFDVFTRIDPFVKKPGLYQLELMDDFGCVSDTFLTVTVDTLPPIVTIDQSGVLACESTEVILTAEFERATTPIVLWIGDNGPLNPQDAMTQTITEGGDFILRIFNVDNSCVGEDRISISQDENTFIDVDLGIIPACQNMNNGEVIINELIGGEGPAEISLDNVTFEESSVLQDLPSGDGTLYVKDANGCTISKPFNIPEGEQVAVELGEEIVSFGGESIEIGIDTSGFSRSLIQWYRDEELFGMDTDSIRFIGETDESIRVEIISENGCVSFDEVDVVIEERITRIYVPNSLLIGDAENGIFRINSNDPLVIAEQLAIYDRWGNLMFSARNSNVNEEMGWDGMVNGSAVEEGVYGYFSLVRLQSGELRKLSGSLTVFR